MRTIIIIILLYLTVINCELVYSIEYTYLSDGCCDIVLDTIRDKIYISYITHDAILVIDKLTLQEVTSERIESIQNPAKILIDNEGSYIYVASVDWPESKIYRINLYDTDQKNWFSLDGIITDIYILMIIMNIYISHIRLIQFQKRNQVSMKLLITLTQDF